MSIREMVVESAIGELKNMLQEAQERLQRAQTIEDTLTLAEEIEELRAALEDAIIHRDHFIKTGFIYQ